MGTLLARFVAPQYSNLSRRLCVSLFFVLVCLCLLHPNRAAADGGAPNLAYVSGTPQGISTIDIAQQKVTDTISLAEKPAMILLSVDGRILYITQPTTGKLVVLATQTKQIICTAKLPGNPSLLAFDPGTNILFVAGNGAARVSALDPMTCAVKYIVSLRGFVYGLAVAVVGSGVSGGNGNQLWVTDTDALNIFDMTGKQLATIAVPGGPQYLCIPAGTTAYVTTRQGTVEAVGLKTKLRTSPLLTGGTFGPMDYDAITGEIYVPDYQHNRIDVLAPVNEGVAVSREPLRVLPVDGAPQSVAITSDGQLGFVALDEGKVIMLDIPGRQVITTIHAGGSPHFIITGLYPSPISFTPQQAFFGSLVDTVLHYGAVIVIVLGTAILLWKEKRKDRE